MEKNKKVAIVTGASSGLGRDFVRQIDSSGEMDEIWVIARRREKLEELARGASTTVKVFPLDLTRKIAFSVVQGALNMEKPRVAMLVNAAGLGKIGMSTDLTLEENDAMMDLNCRAAVDMSLTAIPYMEEGSQLINICSVAGFQPLVGLNTYAASKAFLLSWTKALHYEMRKTGIHVTAVCPYWVKNTEFIQVAQDTKKAEVIKSFPLACDKPDRVVAQALQASKKNKWVVSPSPVARVQRFLTGFLPDRWVVPVWDKVRQL